MNHRSHTKPELELFVIVLEKMNAHLREELKTTHVDTRFASRCESTRLFNFDVCRTMLFVRISARTFEQTFYNNSSIIICTLVLDTSYEKLSNFHELFSSSLHLNESIWEKLYAKSWKHWKRKETNNWNAARNDSSRYCEAYTAGRAAGGVRTSGRFMRPVSGLGNLRFACPLRFSTKLCAT